jgi:Flp pilus assembly protein TadD
VRIVLVAVLVVVALAVRIWHDRQPHPPATPEEAQERARAHPEDLVAQLDWATALHRLHRDDEAESVFKHAATMAPSDARPINALAMLALEHHQPEAALDYCRQSLRLDPKNPDIWHSEGILLQKSAQLGDAAQAFRTAAELNPKDVIAWRQLGVIDFDINQTGAAISDLQHAVQLDPTNVETLVLLGDDAISIGKVDDAKQAYEQAKKLDAGSQEVKLGLARVDLALDPGPADLERIGREIDGVIAARPSSAAYLARGQCSLLRRRYADAVSDLKQCLKLDKRVISAHTYLSRAYAALGKRAEAKAESDSYAKAYARANAAAGSK